jgi:CubicO group peptidase (beta-lactamase class C family)
MPAWLGAAVDYIARWIEFQMRQHEQPGCVIAVAHKDRVVLDEAFGYADLAKRVRMTPRHRFRVASHSKTYCAAAVMKLREHGRLRLDHPAGRYVGGLHPTLARATLGQLLSHRAGVVRDGSDAGQFVDRRPFLDARELRAELREPPTLRPNTRFKYSNHGYGLLGMAVEAIAGEPYVAWLQREIIDAAQLGETLADGPPPPRLPLASGHSGRLPLARRVSIGGEYSTRAIAPAAGVISTARDLLRFYAQLSPAAKHSVLSAASRREMLRGRWRDPHSSIERYYGLGTMSGRFGTWHWFGHSGGLQGYITRTAVLVEPDLALCVLTNAVDGLAHPWLEGAVGLLRAFARHGAPSPTARKWTGRWWTLWNPIDLVPMGGKVLVARPDWPNPLLDASQIEPRGPSDGHIGLAGGYASHAEPARLERGRRGEILEVRLGGTRYRSEKRVAREMAARYTVAKHA